MIDFLLLSPFRLAPKSRGLALSAHDIASARNSVPLQCDFDGNDVMRRQQYQQQQHHLGQSQQDGSQMLAQQHNGSSYGNEGMNLNRKSIMVSIDSTKPSSP